MSFNIIIDTREKEPWTFTSSQITGVVHEKLDTGDYSIQGLEDMFCIERKHGPAEFANNAVSSRFMDVIRRMENYRYRYIIFDCSMSDMVNYPVGSSIPKAKWGKLKVKGQYMIKFISELQTKYKIPVMFAGNKSNAVLMATQLMKRAYELEHGRLHSDT